MLEFLKEEWLTILSIILSGVISWVISAFYFHRGNRENLQSAIIIPLLATIDNEDSISSENFAEIKELSRNPLISFFLRQEK